MVGGRGPSARSTTPHRSDGDGRPRPEIGAAPAGRWSAGVPSGRRGAARRVPPLSVPIVARAIRVRVVVKHPDDGRVARRSPARGTGNFTANRRGRRAVSRSRTDSGPAVSPTAVSPAATCPRTARRRVRERFSTLRCRARWGALPLASRSASSSAGGHPSPARRVVLPAQPGRRPHLDKVGPVRDGDRGRHLRPRGARCYPFRPRCRFSCLRGFGGLTAFWDRCGSSLAGAFLTGGGEPF